jgi:NAD(P)-dependent dehydrogenase (short-subunit alcohol dehydrogenase family)
MRAQAEGRSALRPDTPAQFRVRAESAEVERSSARKYATTKTADIREGVLSARRAAAARVINISSGYGQLKGLPPDVTGYSLSKLALNGLTRAGHVPVQLHQHPYHQLPVHHQAPLARPRVI